MAPARSFRQSCAAKLPQPRRGHRLQLVVRRLHGPGLDSVRVIKGSGQGIVEDRYRVVERYAVLLAILFGLQPVPFKLHQAILRGEESRRSTSAMTRRSEERRVGKGASVRRR